jgi:hypothetical protein
MTAAGRRICFTSQVTPHRLEQTDVNARWQPETATLAPILADGRPDRGLPAGDELFDLDARLEGAGRIGVAP